MQGGRGERRQVAENAGIERARRRERLWCSAMDAGDAADNAADTVAAPQEADLEVAQ